MIHCRIISYSVSRINGKDTLRAREKSNDSRGLAEKKKTNKLYGDEEGVHVPYHCKKERVTTVTKESIYGILASRESNDLAR